MEAQKHRLIEVAQQVSERFNVKAVAMFEEHNHGDHYDVIETFERIESVANAA